MRVIESVAKGLGRVFILSVLALSVLVASPPAKKTVAVFPAGTADTVILPEGTNLEAIASSVIEKAVRGNERLQAVVFTRANPSVRRALNEGMIPSSMLLPPFTGKIGTEFRAVVLGRLMRAHVAVAAIIDSYRFARDTKTARIVMTVETYEIATGKSLGVASVSDEASGEDEKAAAAIAAEKAAASAANEAIEFLTKPRKVGQYGQTKSDRVHMDRPRNPGKTPMDSRQKSLDPLQSARNPARSPWTHSRRSEPMPGKPWNHSRSSWTRSNPTGTIPEVPGPTPDVHGSSQNWGATFNLNVTRSQIALAARPGANPKSRRPSARRPKWQTRCWATIAFLLLACAGLASGSISVSADSAMAVADGKSVVILAAVVRNSSGATVPDGTAARFTTNHGYFREGEVLTANGVARAELVAPSIEGVAVVTVSVPTIGTIQKFDFEFVKDRSLLVTSHQYVDIESDEYLVFHAGIQVVSATGRETPAKLKYRDIQITARDMQFDAIRMQVIARRATLTIGSKSVECANLKYSLNRRKGTAITTLENRLGFYQLTAAEAQISETPTPPREFEFVDVGVSTQSVHADRIVIFPNREVQFYRAKMYVGNTRVMNIPMYAMRPSAETTILGDEIISYNNGGVLLNYPHYLTMSPEYTSLLRFRSGYDAGRGSASSRGIFVDWENKYLLGGEGQGVVTLAGIGRSDMGLNWRHTQRFGERTTANASLDFPAFRSIYGSINASTAFDGFSLNVVGASARTFRGTPFETRRFDISLETDRRPLGDFPITYSFGLTANSSFAQIAGNATSQEGVGWRGRFVYLPVTLWSGASLTGSTTVTQLWNNKASGRFGVLNTISVTTPFGDGAALQLSYDFVHDAFGRSLFGKHRITGNLSWNAKKVSLNLFGGKSIDFDSTTLFLDGSYLLNDKWRIGASFSFDRYLGEDIIDQTLLIGYTLGTREIGVTYNAHSGKFGLTLLNAPIR